MLSFEPWSRWCWRYNPNPLFAMNQRPKKTLQLVYVDQSDVDRMLDCYDSGMFDVSTSNAVALALKRLFRSEHRVRVTRDVANHECFVQIDGHVSKLPEDLFDWLESAEHASPVEPVSFWLDLPNEGLLRPVEKPLKSNQSKRMDQVSLVA